MTSFAFHHIGSCNTNRWNVRTLLNRTLLAMATAVLVPQFSVADDSDLFSSVRGNDVFVGKQDAHASGSETLGNTRRLFDSQQLAQVMQEAGFETNILNGRALTTSKVLDPWTFPVLVSISSDEQHLHVMLGLRTVKDESEASAAELLKMLEANQSLVNARFAFSSMRKRTELIGELSNQSMTGLKIRDEINRLALLASDKEELWYKPAAALSSESSAKSPPADGGEAGRGEAGRGEAGRGQASGQSADTESSSGDPLWNSETPSSVVSEQPDTLNGRWSAARSATEAFAVEFKADGQFVLVYVSGGRQTRSAGSFEIRGSKLTLKATDGTLLTGTWKSLSDQQFQLTLETGAASAAVLTFRRASDVDSSSR